jgi:hypothetical protein
MRIAIVGSAPSSLGLAPYDDPSWEIWGTSPGAAPHVKRVTRWFEVHHYDPAQCPDWYMQWLKDQPAPVYMIDKYDDVPTSVRYPREDVQKELGKYFYTSSVAWMLALAILQKPKEIGLWGIDMAARDEYGYQRAGCHHFITIARLSGINITVPLESDLLRPEPEYGMRNPSPFVVKMISRRNELEGRLTALQTQYASTTQEITFLRGALDDLDYWSTIWSDQDPKSIVGTDRWRAAG